MMMYVTLATVLLVCSIAVSENTKSLAYRFATIYNVRAEDIKNNSMSVKIYTTRSVDTIFVQYSEDQWLYELRRQIKIGQKSRAGPYVIKMMDLKASSKYNFQFRLSELDEWSKVFTYVTLPNVPHVIFSGLSNGALKIEWDSATPDAIEKHQLSYNKVRQTDGNWVKDDCAVTIEIPKCSGSSFTITPLHKDFYYEIFLSAHTSAGYGEYYYFKVHA
ncbi:uncharacterized protein LOC129226578 [Uloborus diversus]|uniref:uncharacterized protein LOC129226578 n=1 Tax=Uloborus diversus TaxID=327109 RepID=UPI00240A1090|nr:uncharacterized protein LOC129226578 [Uloborus diversus]